MNESLLVNSVFVVTTSELTEKGVAEEDEMAAAAAQREELAVDLVYATLYQIVPWNQVGPEEVQQTKDSAEFGFEKLETVHLCQVPAVKEEDWQKEDAVADHAA